MKIGSIYREHQLLFKNKPNPTLTEAAQLERWSKILDGWKRAAQSPHCTVLGDLNLDYLTWNNPQPSHLNMVNKTKAEIETLGFSQIIRGHTRTWRGQKDSLVDQCWSTRPDRIVSWLNETRGWSDHNYTDILLRTKDRKDRTQEIKKRVWKNFQPEEFRNKISKIEWGNFYNCENIDIVNDTFEQKIGDILNTMAPMKNIQLRQKYANWLDEEISQKMKDRDVLREVARGTDNDQDWISYRNARNECSKILKEKEKNNFLKLSLRRTAQKKT